MNNDSEVMLLALSKERDELHDKLMHVDRIIKKIKDGDYFERDGKVKTEVMFPGKTFKERVRDNVSTDAELVTDAHLGYAGLDLEFADH